MALALSVKALQCVAELGRKDFSQRWCLISQAFGLLVGGEQGCDQWCQLLLISTHFMELLINFLHSFGAEWPPKDLDCGSANSPSTLGRTKTVILLAASFAKPKTNLLLPAVTI